LDWAMKGGIDYYYECGTTHKKVIKILLLHEMKFKELINKNSDYSIDIYEILINKIKEKSIVKDIINMIN